MEFEVVRVIKESDKSSVLLIREKESSQLYVQKRLTGIHHIYELLQECPHPFIPQIYDVEITESTTMVIEEYIKGQPPEVGAIDAKDVRAIIKELCAVLEFLHGKGIIHRDIKPSNIILAEDGHIRLIDFDAARVLKDEAEQDTRLLGTRDYAAPEQYGFAQTDERTDIFALGVTFGHLLGKNAQKPRYRRVINKCTDLDPNKRYQSARQIKNAVSYSHQGVASLLAVVMVLAVWWGMLSNYSPPKPVENSPTSNSEYSSILLPDGRVSLENIVMYSSGFEALISEIESLGGHGELPSSYPGEIICYFGDDPVFGNSVKLTLTVKEDWGKPKVHAVSAYIIDASIITINEDFTFELTPEEVVALAEETDSIVQRGGVSMRENPDMEGTIIDVSFSYPDYFVDYAYDDYYNYPTVDVMGNW